MFGSDRVLALIPARAGSKGLPQKNVLEVAGLPLIGWTIQAAQRSRYVDRVVVSTDGPGIARIAQGFGADVPFVRPAALASDDASTRDVVLHCMNEMDAAGEHYDLLVLLQPTSPLRISDDVDAALELLVSRHAEAIVSVCKVDHSPLWSNTLPTDGDMRDFVRQEVMSLPRQSLPDYYRVNGAIYVARWDRLRSGEWFFGPGSFAYVMPPERSVDVDSLFDLQVAECLLARRMAAASRDAKTTPADG